MSTLDLQFSLIKEIFFFFFFFEKQTHTQKRGKGVLTQKRNVMSTIFSQQILSDKLLLVIIGKQKSYLSCKFKLARITTYHLMICFKFCSSKIQRNIHMIN